MRRTSKGTSFLGIDPGVHGALVLLSADGEIERVEAQPLIGKSEDLGAMRKLAAEFAPHCRLVVVEKLFTGPMNRHSAAVLNRLCGLWIGLFLAHQCSMIEVRPQDWQGRFISGKKKGTKPAQEYRRYANNLWLDADLDEDESAAALLAEFGRLRYVRG